MEQVKKDLANYASDRYSASLQEIELIRSGIYHNRKGSLPLTDIPHNRDRLALRMEREGLPPDQAIERINGVPNFQDVFIIRELLRLSESVCRITISSPFGGSGFGTGFLIAPGLLITNHHVFPDAGAAEHSVAQFSYELTGKGSVTAPVSFKLKPQRFFMSSSLEKNIMVPYSGLDFTIVAVDEVSDNGIPITDFPYTRFDETLGKIVEGENCIVIQHPAGDYKKIVLKDIRMITLTDNFLIYESDTLPGSSGSMVVGLGTGQVVALHHSGVPRRNDKGQWLRKDGLPVQPGDTDDVIDWIGNEGIRVSSIVKAIRSISIPPDMEPYRQQILGVAQADAPSPRSTQPVKPVKVESTPVNVPAPTTGGVLYFELELSANEALYDDFITDPGKYINGFVQLEPLFPLSADPDLRRYKYLTVRSAVPPYELAAELEALPQVESCTPDLPAYTDIGLSDANAGGMATGQEESFIFNDGSAKENEPDFMKRWEHARLSKPHIDNKDLASLRRWNWDAVYPPFVVENEAEDQRKNREQWEKKCWDNVDQLLPFIKIAQLDTGYSLHGKVKNGYNFQEDMDFIDEDDDAVDSHSKWLLKFPGHGTRTASLVIGDVNSNYAGDGNLGMLVRNGKLLQTLIPYRIAKSVILIGRGKELADAINHAVLNEVDVAFMCMGSYPRPMIARVAKMAYDAGLIWVCAAGNEVEMVIAPALYPGTIAVAAINPDEKPWKGSSYGKEVDVAAPGEDVYVPFIDKDGREIMVYGSGTSYATPHVASAAAMWKAAHHETLSTYTEKWMIPEAFRICLRNSARNPGPDWKAHLYGKGILDIPRLIAMQPPKKEEMEGKYAYDNKKVHPKDDLGIREGIAFLWNLGKRLTTKGPVESMQGGVSNRGRTALEALMKPQEAGALESTPMAEATKARQVLADYFHAYSE
ncbi:MAG: S8 family serine peptidase [Chitinophagaceae bacterium]